jgi:hypothetical protein
MSDPELFEYDGGILPDGCFSETFDVFVVPSVPRHMLSDAMSVIPEVFSILRQTNFGSDVFRQELQDLCIRTGLDRRVLYRLAGLLILVDQRKKMQYLTQGTVMQSDVIHGPHYNASFTYGVPLRRVTRSELRCWAKNISASGRKRLLRSLDAMYNVMVMEGDISINHGDMILLFNTCGTYFGHVFGYWNLEYARPAMIGIRSSIARILRCGKKEETVCLNKRLGLLLYTVRTMLATIDGFDRVMVTDPIGGMSRLIQSVGSDLQDMLRSRTSFRTDVLVPYLKNVRHIYLPTYRRPLTLQHAMQIILDRPDGEDSLDPMQFVDLAST